MQDNQNDSTDIIAVEIAKTLDGLFAERVRRSPEKIAYRYFNPVDEQWCSYTWEQMNLLIARWQAANPQPIRRADSRMPHRRQAQVRAV